MTEDAQQPVTPGQECSGFLVLAQFFAVGYVEGVPSTGVPGKMHPATAHEVAGALKHCQRLAEDLAELHAWVLEAMRRLRL